MREQDGNSFDDDWAAFAPTDPPEEGPGLRADPLAWLVIALAVATVIGIVVLRPTGVSRDVSGLDVLGVPSDFHAAEVIAVGEQACFEGSDIICTTVDFELIEGPDAGEVYTQDFPASVLNRDFTVGDVAILSRRSPNGTVIAVENAPCDFDPDQTCRTLDLLLEGEPPRQTTYVALAVDPAARLGVGDEAIVDLFPDSDTEVAAVLPPDIEISYQYSGDVQRRPLLLVVTVLFAAAVIAVGRWRGVAALGGLAASIAVLLLFVLPAILDGRSPVLVAVVGAAAIAFVTLYLAHGFNRMTHVAVIGMISALGLTAVLSAIAVSVAQFSGFASEESTLLTLFDGIDVAGILLAGIVLGTAGALDDVTVTQASAVWALVGADPTQSEHMLFTRAMRVGRDHIASTVNTLLLAYAGAALPLLILFVMSQQSLGAIANSEIVAVEIVRTLIGSMGLVAAVPITTWLAARTAAGDPGIR